MSKTFSMPRLHLIRPRLWPWRAAWLLAALAGCGSPRPLPPAAPLPQQQQQPTRQPAEAPPGATPAPASNPEATTPAGFSEWVAAFRAEARAAGIDDATLDACLAGARYLPRVVELDRAQPEFTRAVWDYLDNAVSPARVGRGLEKLRQYRAEADAASARHGVPASVIAAIWGMESNYGANYGDIPAIDALATLGFEGRRGPWARAQLVAALKIVRNGDIDRAHMVGSWAGAMGQTQFLPSVFLAHAVDADGDGRRDIWNSMADVMASTANFLAHSGWLGGQPWGVEVTLPPGFDVGRADTERRPAAEWAAEGVRAAVGPGAPLPPFAESTLLLPAGARGPAFLVGPNFRAILRYNNSTSYALGVGLLAQRLDGGPGVQAAWPRDLPALTRSQLTALQTALNGRGFDAGAADGMMGPATREGLKRYQRSVGLPADGYPTVELLQRLQGP